MKRPLMLFWHLLKTDMIIYQQKLIGNVIDNMIWVSAVTFITAYIFPLMGMSVEYGTFYATSSIVSCAVFRILTYVSTFLADLEGTNTFSYLQTLPISMPLLCFKTALGYTLYTSLQSLFTIPVIKIILGDKFLLRDVAWIKFSIAFISFNLFFGIFSFFTASITARVSESIRAWGRIIFPLWIYGGAQFSWKTLNSFSPVFAYINLANPFLYAMEAVHGTMLREQDYLNFYTCIGVLWVSAILFFWWAYFRLKKRLDFIS